MGSDMWHLQRDIERLSHPELVGMLRKVRDQLVRDQMYRENAEHWDALIAEIDQTLNNASIA
jgi:hypothetical protein